ncbi:MAG TPA: hypothetical protein VGE41_12625, partial [Verrucomicrobiae bacterium]
MGFFSDSKDLLVGSMALPMLNSSLLKPYGQAKGLKINSSTKSASIVLDLHGETEPVQIDIQKYDLTREGDRVFLTIHGISTSRE